MFQVDEWQAVEKPIERPRAHGRFLYRGDEKFFIKGVTYGPFPANAAGEPLPEPARVAQDFRAMRQLGVNTARVYYVPPRWFLDLARDHGIHLMVGIPWPQHICFLDQWEVKEEIKDKMREAARACKGHPAVLAYLIGNEIPCHIVRWHGARRIEDFLRKMADLVRAEDPGCMVTYANYPSTEYLRLGFLDFLSVNVYLQDKKAFRSYVKRLQNVAGEIPLVLSEFGLDSMRNGEEKQAETLEWQVHDSFELGCSGTVVFAWTDEWYTGGHLIEDWAFGIVDADRKPKPAYHAVKKAYAHSLPALPAEAPFISVVVCAYNAESTMDGCLASFFNVDYPNFEVIVVNDGSTDRTGEISDAYAARCSFIRVIHQPNKGLSVARNVGMNASRGSIVAYTDSDCYVDPHWLHYMAWAFAGPEGDRFVAVGGPNLPPSEDNRTAACVAVSPGAPTHVLITDEVAEHIPGCNMAFRKDKLMEIGGFDATYRAAGDDVDVCWRLQDKGYEIGFSAAMFVWHHRRCTLNAYLKQQKGYGRAEALLVPKHPERFNALGNSRWAGRIYGDISGHMLSSRPVIYHGAFGYGLFQTLYEPKATISSYLPMSFEWIFLSLLFLVLGAASQGFWIASGLMIGATLAWTGHCAKQARLPKQYDDWRSRLLIMALTLSQPLCRGWTRYRTLAQLGVTWKAAAKDVEAGQALQVSGAASRGLWNTLREGMSLLSHKFAFQTFFWNNKGMEREELLDDLLASIKALKVNTNFDTGFSRSGSTPPWDVQVRPGVWSKVRLRVTVENHGGDKRFARIGTTMAPNGLSKSLMLGGVIITGMGLALGSHLIAGAMAAATLGLAGWVLADHFRASRLVTLLTQRLIMNHADRGPVAETPAAKPVKAPVQQSEIDPEVVKTLGLDKVAELAGLKPEVVAEVAAKAQAEQAA